MKDRILPQSDIPRTAPLQICQCIHVQYFTKGSNLNKTLKHLSWICSSKRFKATDLQKQHSCFNCGEES